MVSLVSAEPLATSIYFLKKDDIHQVEKPYAFRFPIDTIKQTNMEMEKIENIQVTDIRGREGEFSLEKDGFAIAKLFQDFEYDIFFDNLRLQSYFRDLELLLKKTLGAAEVRVFRHGLRKRHPDFPISTGDSYEYDQPTSVAHIDTTPEEAQNEIRRQYGNEAGKYLARRRYQWINIWKPLKGPLNDWPLTFCSSSNVTLDDVESADLLYPDLATENYQVYYREKYKWYYLSDHTTSEVIIFKQSDSDPNACQGVPHCSFNNSLASLDEPPRESIEVRALAFYN